MAASNQAMPLQQMKRTAMAFDKQNQISEMKQEMMDDVLDDMDEEEEEEGTVIFTPPSLMYFCSGRSH